MNFKKYKKKNEIVFLIDFIYKNISLYLIALLISIVILEVYFILQNQLSNTGKHTL